MHLLTTLFYLVFILSAFFLVVIILLQEGKGGGFGGALGAAGQQTFGVKAAGIHKVTAAIAATFLISALAIHVLNRQDSQSTVLDETSAPLGGGAAGTGTGTGGGGGGGAGPDGGDPGTE